jgi:TPR repeat protein
MKSHQFVSVKSLLIFACFMVGDIFASPNSYVDEIKSRAIRGEPAAQFSLGFLYHSGQGVSRDIVEAIDWYEKSAEQGFLEAQLRLGSLYDFGKEISEDNTEALKWYVEAAKRGHADSQAYLGKMYFNGEGVAQSDVKAFLWWTLAAQKGSSKAKTFIRETRGVIRKHHAAEARQLAQICDQSSYQNCKW